MASDTPDIAVGDVLEVIEETHWLSESIAELDGLSPPLREGWLVEVTAVDDTDFMGFLLLGTPTGTAFTYAGCNWHRGDGKRVFTRSGMILRVGRAVSDGYEWLFPERINVWTRCQETEQ